MESGKGRALSLDPQLQRGSNRCHRISQIGGPSDITAVTRLLSFKVLIKIVAKKCSAKILTDF